MTDALERVLQLVAEGRLSAEEAAPILEGLDRKSMPGVAPGPGFAPGPSAEDGLGGGIARPAGYARIEVRESGRRIVDLRIPISLGRFALSRVPGLSREQIAEVEEAVVSGARGPILDVQDTDGSGVRIVLE